MLVQSSQRAGAMRKLIAPLLVICLSVLGLSAQADNDGHNGAASSSRSPIVSAATSIQGCNEGLIMHNGAYTCRSILWVSQGGVKPDVYVSQGGIIPDPVVAPVVVVKHLTGCAGPFGREIEFYSCTYSDGSNQTVLGGSLTIAMNTASALAGAGGGGPGGDVCGGGCGSVTDGSGNAVSSTNGAGVSSGTSAPE